MDSPTILSVLAAVIYMMLAVYPLATGTSTRPSRIFLVLTLLLAACSAFHALAFSASSAQTAWNWFVAGSIAWALFTPLCLLLPLELARGRALPAWIFVVAGVPAIITFVVTMTVDAGPSSLVLTAKGWARDVSAAPILFNTLAVVLFGYIIAALGVIGWWMRQAPTRREQHQTAWLLGSGMLAIATALLFQVLNPLSDVPTAPRMNYLFGVLWAAGYAIAIFRHRLMAPSLSLAAETILARIQDMVFVVDLEGRVLEANSRALALMGAPIARIRRVRAESLFDPPDAIRAALDQAAILDSEPAWTEASLKVHTGQPIPVHVMFAPVIDDFTDYLGIVAIAQDQRPMREALKAERITSIGLLAGGIAHDFNNLLTAIGGNVDLARMDIGAGSTADRRLLEASRAVSRAQGLTQQLLTFSNGGAPIRKATSLADILHDSATFATSGSRVLPDIRVPDDLWLADVDGNQIAQVVHNLALNAVQAMHDGGTLTITAENVPAGDPGVDGRPLDGPRIRLTIADQGPGIPPEYLPRVSEPFFSTKPDGSGLGLATCESIVRRHEGQMTIESLVGCGTTVRVDLLRAKHHSSDLAILVPRVPQTGGRVLVMDDQQQVAAVACEMLRAMGWEAVCTHDGDDAVREFVVAAQSDHPFDLLLLDLTVPGGTGGVESLEKIRASSSGVYAVVSSGYGDEAVLSAPREHGFDDVLPKPYSCAQMREMLARFERRRLTRSGRRATTVPG